MTANPSSSVPFFQIRRDAGSEPLVRQNCLWVKIPAILLGLASAALAQTSGNFTYTDNGVDVTITGYSVGAPTNVIIPATITVSEDPLVVKPVVGIGASAFSGRVNLTGVTIPSSVKSLGNSAFYQCTALTEVQGGAGVETISRFAFGGCTALSIFTLPSGVKSLGTSAFGGCSALTSVTIPSGAAIGERAFSGCSGLTTVSISPTVASIGIQAFRYCSGLTTITIPDVATLPSLVFAGCRGLTTVNIPASVTAVDVTAFSECSALTSFTVDPGNVTYSSVGGLLTNEAETQAIICPGGLSGNFTIPTGLTEIGAQAFQSCAALTGVTFHTDVASIANKAFSGCSKLINAVFLGDPPTFVAANAFELVAQGFKIYYLTSGTGFTSPDWEYSPGLTLPAVFIEAVTPEFTWLSSYGLAGDTDFLTDANGDGVNLLMAYALNMNPNLRNTFPQPVFSANQMSLTHYANTPGISYTVKTSTDLTDWTTTGVVLSGSAAARTATVAFSGPNRFMRLEVSK